MRALRARRLVALSPRGCVVIKGTDWLQEIVDSLVFPSSESTLACKRKFGDPVQAPPRERRAVGAYAVESRAAEGRLAAYSARHDRQTRALAWAEGLGGAPALLERLAECEARLGGGMFRSEAEDLGRRLRLDALAKQVSP